MNQLILKGMNKTSHIYLEAGILEKVGVMSMGYLNPKRVLIVTDKNVAPLYLIKVMKSFEAAGGEVSSHIIPAGEQYKTLNTVEGIYDALFREGITRSDLIVALGGGVVGDITGFAANSFLRGVHLVQIPTTLLAQVDSSVGGKCGVDLPQGKNLVGAFNQPDMVFIDGEVLKTLPTAVFEAGMAEVIKYGCILDESILTWAKKENALDTIADIVKRCVELKRDVVEQDEQDTGLRMILNFGHTVGHGVEKLGNFKAVTHGQGVSIGMVAAMQLGEAAGITPKGFAALLVTILKKYHLPTELPYDWEAVFAAMMSDKKKEGTGINFIYVKNWGETLVKKIEISDLKKQMNVLEAK